MKSKKDSYEDIIHMPHHVSAVHPQMAAQDRAAQFSPFAALTGYDAAIKETARLTDEYIELNEDEKAALDDNLRKIKMHIEDHPLVHITYFKPDEKKSGGEYVSLTQNIKRIDEYKKCIILMDGTKISINQIYLLVEEVKNEGEANSSDRHL